MEIIIWFFLGISFLFFNTKIIVSDIREKIVPNKYLLFLILLLPFWYIYAMQFSIFPDISFGASFLQFIIAFIVAFWLFHFWLWGAWDAKYLLILWLFIPYMSIISMVGSIAIVTLMYLITSFIWFWTGRNILQKNFHIYKHLWNQKRSEILQKKQYLWKKKYYRNILSTLCLFIIFFGTIRLVRVYIIEYISRKTWLTPFEIIQYILQSNIDIFIVWIGMIVIIMWVFILSRLTYLKFQERLGYNLQIAFLAFICLLISPFVYHDVVTNPEWFKTKLILIFTLYMWIYILIKVLLAGYKIVFKSEEEVSIYIDDLHPGMIVNKEYLLKNFWSQDILENYFEENTKATKMIVQIKNPLDEEDCEKIKEIYKVVKDHHTNKKTEWYNELSLIRIMRVFALSPYIFLGFFLSFIDLSGRVSNIISDILLRQ